MERNKGAGLKIIKTFSMKSGEIEEIVANMIPLGDVEGTGYKESTHRSELIGIISAENDAVINAISKAEQLRADLLVLEQPKHEVWPDSFGVAISGSVKGSAYRNQENSSQE